MRAGKVLYRIYDLWMMTPKPLRLDLSTNHGAADHRQRGTAEGLQSRGRPGKKKKCADHAFNLGCPSPRTTIYASPRQGETPFGRSDLRFRTASGHSQSAAPAMETRFGARNLGRGTAIFPCPALLGSFFPPPRSAPLLLTAPNARATFPLVSSGCCDHA